MKTRSIITLFLTLGLCVGAADAKGKKKEQAPSLDTDGNGTVSLVEYQAGSTDKDKAKTDFEKADANHDGQLDKTELATLKPAGKKGGKKKQ